MTRNKRLTRFELLCKGIACVLAVSMVILSCPLSAWADDEMVTDDPAVVVETAPQEEAVAEEVAAAEDELVAEDEVFEETEAKDEAVEPEPELTAQYWDGDEWVEPEEVQLTFVPKNGVKRFMEGTEDSKEVDDETGKTYLYFNDYLELGDQLIVTSSQGKKTFTYTKIDEEDGYSYCWTDEQGNPIDERYWISWDVRIDEAAIVLDNEMDGVVFEYFEWDSDDNCVAQGTATAPVIIYSNPVANLEYVSNTTKAIYRGYDSDPEYTEWRYDEDDNEYELKYEYYWFPYRKCYGDQLIVNYTDGTSKTFTYGEAYAKDEYGDEYYRDAFICGDEVITEDYSSDPTKQYMITSDQAYENAWGLGEHEFTLEYMKRECQIPVTVKEQTITAISFVPQTPYTTTTAAMIAFARSHGLPAEHLKYNMLGVLPDLVAGDKLVVTEGSKVTEFAYDPVSESFVSTVDSSDVIPKKAVGFDTFYASASNAEPVGYIYYEYIDGTFTVKNVAKAPQKVNATNKEVALKKKVAIEPTSSGFYGTQFTFKSSNTKVATVNAYGVVTGKKAGKAKITIVAKENAGYKQSAAKTITIRVGKANPMKVKAKKATVKLSAVKKKAQVVTGFTVKNVKGKVTVKNVSTTKATKKFKVASSGKITVPKGTKKGTYSIKVQVKAKGTKGTSGYIAGTKTVTCKITVK